MVLEQHSVLHINLVLIDQLGFTMLFGNAALNDSLVNWTAPIASLSERVSSQQLTDSYDSVRLIQMIRSD